MSPVAEGTAARILIVEDDPSVRSLVAQVLAIDGHTVVEAADAPEAMELFAAHDPDLVLIDIGLPGIDGMGLLARIRAGSQVPVIMLTGRGGEADRIHGLKSGADDYIAKPFSIGELSARVESVLRRSRVPTAGAPAAAGGALRFDDLEIDVASREVRRDGSVVALTAREFDLLTFLAQAPRQVFSREQLLRQVWDSSAEWQDDATVTEHIRRVRRKVERDPDAPRWLVTVRGAGYRFEP